MTHNIFRFGDTYWSQLSGTAMGTPPAPMYATLYFGILEQRFLPQFPECTFSTVAILTTASDFGFLHRTNLLPLMTCNGYCSKNPSTQYLYSRMDVFAPILFHRFSWRNYLTHRQRQSLHSRVFEKALNLYLYLPRHSCHPPGILKGLIYGMMLRFFRLSTDSASRPAASSPAWLHEDTTLLSSMVSWNNHTLIVLTHNNVHLSHPLSITHALIWTKSSWHQK